MSQNFVLPNALRLIPKCLFVLMLMWLMIPISDWNADRPSHRHGQRKGPGYVRNPAVGVQRRLPPVLHQQQDRGRLPGRRPQRQGDAQGPGSILNGSHLIFFWKCVSGNVCAWVREITGLFYAKRWHAIACLSRNRLHNIQFQMDSAEKGWTDGIILFFSGGGFSKVHFLCSPVHAMLSFP